MDNDQNKQIVTLEHPTLGPMVLSGTGCELVKKISYAEMEYEDFCKQEEA